MLSAWVDAPRRLVSAAQWSGGFTTCVDLLGAGAPAIDVFDIERAWRPRADEPAALRALSVGDLAICAGRPMGFGDRTAADVADAMRRRHLDFVRTERIAGIADFLRLSPKALDEEASRVAPASSIVLPGA